MYKNNIHKCTFNLVDKCHENSLKGCNGFQKIVLLGIKLIFTNRFIIKLKPSNRCNPCSIYASCVNALTIESYKTFQTSN